MSELKAVFDMIKVIVSNECLLMAAIIPFDNCLLTALDRAICRIDLRMSSIISDLV